MHFHFFFLSDMSNTADKTTSSSDSYLNQITLLKILSGQLEKVALDSKKNHDRKEYNINELTELARLADEKEVIRYLFILEGQKLVSPLPEGDFTSRHWKITDNGVRVLKTISKTTLLS